MSFTPQVYSLNFCFNSNREQLEFSNQVILPPEILANNDVNLDHNPLFFTFKNNDVKINVGVYEFTDIPDICYIPYYLMLLLNIKEGERISISNLNNIPKGTELTLKPHEEKFIQLSDPRSILEKHLSINYPILSINDVVRIKYLDEIYSLSVTNLKPGNTVQLINCNINLLFDQAYDHKLLPKKELLPQPEKRDVIHNSRKRKPFSKNFVPFQGKGYRLGDS
jgi:hypothetical protein